MGSPVTLSGFNNIDFSVVIDAIIRQERQPVDALTSQKTALESQKTKFGALASKLASLQSAVDAVVGVNALDATKATVSDSARLSVSAEANAAAGSYEVYVDQLARAQVSTSQLAYDDKETTAVAGAGTLRFTDANGSVDVALTGDVTLQGLADAINGTDNVPVSASIIRNTDGKYQLVLTGRETGGDLAFSIDTSAFTGPSGGGAATGFSQVQAAQDARIRFNGVTATSSTNTFQGVINRVSFTALQADVANPVTVTITADYESVVSLVSKLVAAFNDTTNWISSQTGSSDAASIGRDPLVRSLRSQLSSAITAAYKEGGSFSALAEIGFSFSRTGQLELNDSAFRAALEENKVDVAKVFGGSDGSGGAFGRLATSVEEYTKAGGLVPSAEHRLTDQVGQLANRIADMEDRLALRRAALQKEYAAADALIAQLNAQKGSLDSLGSQYSLF